MKSVDLPAQRVSDMSPFCLNGNLNFDAINLTPMLLFDLFDAFVSSLPSKLSVLYRLWTISDDVSNRALWILSASLCEKGRVDFTNPRKDRALSCLRNIIQSIEGGGI
jgi:hypothetical protein